MPLVNLTRTQLNEKTRAWVDPVSEQGSGHTAQNCDDALEPDSSKTVASPGNSGISATATCANSSVMPAMPAAAEPKPNKFFRYLSQSIQRFYTEAETTKLLDGISMLRENCKKQRESRYIQVVITGWAQQPQRNLFFRALKYATRADIFFGSYIGAVSETTQGLQRFEVFVSCYVNRDTNVWHDPDDIVTYIETFKMSLSCVDVSNASFSTGELPSQCVLSALERIQNGSWHYGNWHARKNFLYRERVQDMIEQRIQQQRHHSVLQETGLTFTPGNMLAIYFEYRNTLREVQYMDQSLNNVRNQLIQMIAEVASDNSNSNESNFNQQNSNHHQRIRNRLSEIIRRPVWLEIHNMTTRAGLLQTPQGVFRVVRNLPSELATQATTGETVLDNAAASLRTVPRPPPPPPPPVDFPPVASPSPHQSPNHQLRRLSNGMEIVWSLG